MAIRIGKCGICFDTCEEMTIIDTVQVGCEIRGVVLGEVYRDKIPRRPERVRAPVCDEEETVLGSSNTLKQLDAVDRGRLGYPEGWCCNQRGTVG